MPDEALPLEDVVSKPNLPSLLEERQLEAPSGSDQHIQSEETLATSIHESGAAAKSQVMRRQANIMYASMLYTMLLSGWNDGTTGPLLPRIQAVYDVCPLISDLEVNVAALTLYTTRRSASPSSP